jgi:DNA-binding NarL/FixJ family response regulator
MPEKARIVWFEDDVDFLSTWEMFLKINGHDVVRTVGTKSEAERALDTLEADGIQVAILDGNLSVGDMSGADGAYFAEQIRSRYPKIGIIGNSTREPVRGADVQSSKFDGPGSLEKAVRAISYPINRPLRG